MIAYCRRVKLIQKSWFQLRKRQYLLSRPAVALLTLLLGLSIGLTPAHAASHPKAHVYLIRGLLNVFSLGMDEIAAKLRQQGIPASVSNHLLGLWSPRRPPRITGAGEQGLLYWLVTRPAQMRSPTLLPGSANKAFQLS